MALSQPRSEQKIDEAEATQAIRRDDTQDQISDGEYRSEDKEQLHGKSDQDEHLNMWRTGSCPPEFQGRSTNSFIKRLVRLPLYPPFIAALQGQVLQVAFLPQVGR